MRSEMRMDMKFIGITGGVGAGKSLVLSCLKEYEGTRVLLADEVGNLVKLPGQPCYEPLVSLLGQEALDQDGRINREKMAARIFADRKLLAQVNEVIHPAVKEYILARVEEARREGRTKWFFLEAALLIEDGYEELVDELWYIHADEAVRARRLEASRGYSREKISRIFASQLSEKEFRRHCRQVIENNGEEQAVREQVRRLMEKGE